jgi:hypothetical protein
MRARRTIPIIAQDTRVARSILQMAEALVLGSPLLSGEVAEVLARELIFKNGIAFATFPASKASVRGLSSPGCLLDEYAWVSIEGASDVELVRQVRPAMIQFGNSRRLLKLSTPWQRSGVLYDEYSQRLARPDLLVWQASTQTMTPRIAAEDLERERLADPAYYSREFEAQFTDDNEAFIPATDTAAAIAVWKELAPDSALSYTAALDASGLSGGDRFVVAVGHLRPEGQVVDLLRGWQRAAVPQVLDEIASLCRAYRIRRIVADQYSFSFVAELLRQRDIELAQQNFSARSKPEIFFALKNALAAGQMQLPNHPEMIRELRALESTRLSGGGYKIGAPRGMHDDYVTTLALLAHSGSQPQRTPWVFGCDTSAGSSSADDRFFQSSERRSSLARRN